MADNYSTELPDHEGASGDTSHEHTEVSEPSEYEFADESGATADVEHNEESPLSEEQAPRRSPLLPIAAAVGGVLLLGAVAWWQLGGHPAETPPSPVPTEAGTPIHPLGLTPAHPPKSLGASAQPEAPLPTAPRVANTPEMAITDAGSSPALPSNGVQSAPTVSSSSAPPSPPVASRVAPPESTAPLAAAPAPSIAPAPAPVPADAARIEALTARIDSLQKALDQSNQQLSQVTNMVAAAANSGGINPRAAAGTQERLSKIEQQLAELQHSQPALSAPPSSPHQEAASESAITESENAPPRHAHTHKVVHKVPRKPSRKATHPTEATTWVLRSATPGHAWVATDATSHDLKSLQVGDTLAGIGRVTAIQQRDDHWIVQGTRGSIQ